MPEVATPTIAALHATRLGVAPGEALAAVQESFPTAHPNGDFSAAAPAGCLSYEVIRVSGTAERRAGLGPCPPLGRLVLCSPLRPG